MIKRIELINFQSHAHTVLDTASNIVVLSGESNCGKTAILRGLLWLITNRPSGIGFVSNWAKEKNTKGDLVLKKNVVCSVTIDITDSNGIDHTITRLRSKDKNVYVVDDKELEAVGTNVPDEVNNIVNMRDCNIQSQDDEYFMLTLPAGQVASKLNELVHLDSIDKAYEYLKKAKMGTNAVYREWSAMASENKFKFDGLKHIPELAESLTDANEVLTKIEDLSEFVESAGVTLMKLQQYKHNLEHIVPDCDKAIERIADLIDDYHSLKFSYGEMIELKRTYYENARQLEHTPEIDYTEIVADIDRHSMLIDQLNDITALVDKIALLEKDSKECERRLSFLEEQLPDICPTCGHLIDKENL